MLRSSIPCLLLLALCLCGCQPRRAVRDVVVYTSIDQVYAEPILNDFERQTGIRVLAVYDVEASKTTGLANRLIAERSRARADVFLSGEFSQTLALKAAGVLAPYRSPAAAGLPIYDAENYWAGFGGRARVLLVNTQRVARSRCPASLFDLLDPAWPRGQVGMALPLFGTAATHAAALYACLGPEKARSFYRQLAARGVRVVDGNSVVRDLVARGDLMVGITDTDDACAAIRAGAPVRMIVPDQGAAGLGTLVIPGTVSLVANAPHAAEGRRLIDYLASPDMDSRLVTCGWSQISLRASGVRAEGMPQAELRPMQAQPADVFGQLATAIQDLTEIFVR